MLLIDSLYINNSGGKVLLDYLVSELEKRNICPFYLFDARCSNDYLEISNEQKVFLKASIINRYKFYKQNANKFSTVFCFGNVPPPIKLKILVYTYFHNVSILRQPSNYETKERFLKIFKKFYIRLFSKNTSYYVVQSSLVKKMLCKNLSYSNSKCLIIPFYKPSSTCSGETKKKKEMFLYVSNGNTHKNHDKLLQSWELLAEKNVYPELHLTITPNHPLLINKIKLLQNKGLKIINHGFIDPTELYQESKYIIYSSLTESFGLGLIEGVEFDCDAITADREYVYEVVEPSKVFDPENPRSIADSVLYVLNNEYKSSKVKTENKIDDLIKLISNETNPTRPEIRSNALGRNSNPAS